MSGGGDEDRRDFLFRLEARGRGRLREAEGGGHGHDTCVREFTKKEVNVRN